MANLNVNATITAPENIEIELVRADALSTSNVYRTFFEIFLSIASALVGAILSINNVSTIHWIFLVVVSVSSAIFLYLSLTIMKKGKTSA